MHLSCSSFDTSRTVRVGVCFCSVTDARMHVQEQGHRAPSRLSQGLQGTCTCAWIPMLIISVWRLFLVPESVQDLY